MSRDEANAVLALKNAWLGVVTSAQALVNMAPAVEALPQDTSVASLDLETYLRVAAAHALAVTSLRGLIDDLKPKAEPVV